MRALFSIPVLACLAALCPLPVGAQSSRGTALTLTVGAECSVGLVTQSPGAVTFNYKIRTAGNGGGRITLRLIAANPANYSETSTLEYRTTLSGPGTPVSGTIPMATVMNAGIAIAQLGSDAHSSRAGATGTVEFTVNPPPVLPMDPLRPSFSVSCQ